MKKIVMFIFTVILAFTFSVTAFATDSTSVITRKDATSKIIQALYDSAYKNEKSFDIDSYYCLHASGYTHFVPDKSLRELGYPVLCVVYSNVAHPNFSDIKTPENTISLAKSMGIVRGLPDGTFHPQDALTYNQAYAMLASAFYKNFINPNLSYPNDFIDTASRAGFIENYAQGEEKITIAAFEKMLNYCIEKTKDTIKNVLFSPALTPEKCVEYYADALKNRNGMLQYALLCNTLQEKYRSDFEAFNWVTGVSSPWVDSFSIGKIDNLIYEITFNWVTSSGPTSTTHLRLELKPINLGEMITYEILSFGNE